MKRLRSVSVSLAAGMAVALAGCNMVDPDRPAPQPDTTVFGNFLEVEKIPDDPASGTVRIRVGVPRALTAAQEAAGRTKPVVEKGVVAEVTVTADTVVLLHGRPAELEDFDPGSELVALPLLGTTRMVGDSTIRMEATFLMDFESYRAWKLPGLGEREPGEAVEADPGRINTSGIERAPVPVGAGRVLYFSARLRLPVDPDRPLIGPRRPGLEEAREGRVPVERTYRTELGSDGWAAPELVQFAGLDDARAIRVSWVNDDETECLVTVQRAAEDAWVGRASRPRATGVWGEASRVDALGKGMSADAVYLAGSKTKICFTSRWPGESQTDLFLFDPKEGDAPQLLAPNVNSLGDEWGARVGPKNELFFCRADRQLVLVGGEVVPLRSPGSHRALLNQAAPTRDGRWVFLCIPKLTPVELDDEIYVAEWRGNGALGEAVPVDEWRPGAAE